MALRSAPHTLHPDDPVGRHAFGRPAACPTSHVEAPRRRVPLAQPFMIVCRPTCRYLDAPLCGAICSCENTSVMSSTTSSSTSRKGCRPEFSRPLEWLSGSNGHDRTCRVPSDPRGVGPGELAIAHSYLQLTGRSPQGTERPKAGLTTAGAHPPGAMVCTLLDISTDSANSLTPLSSLSPVHCALLISLRSTPLTDDGSE